MGTKLTVAMYHYVRPIKDSHYPKIKGLELSLFREQLDYLQNYYTFVSLQDVIAHYKNGASLPPKALWLTFDDGYKDHFEFVLPELLRREVAGTFFVPYQAVSEKTLLDVNKIHFILASAYNEQDLVDYIFARLDQRRGQYGLPSNEELYQAALNQGNRYDSPQIVFVKQALQRKLPLELREEIIAELMHQFVGKSEKQLSEELYMSESEVSQLASHQGIDIGAHGYKHVWLNTVSSSELNLEIEKSIEFLSKFSVPQQDWSFCYPYGAYNQEVVSKLRDAGIHVSVTAQARVADLSQDSPFEIPRLDTNDLPKDSRAKPDSWYDRG